MPISDLRGCDWLMRIPTEIERPRAELALKNTLKDKPCKGDIFSIRAMDHGEVISQGIPVEWYSRLLSNSLGETIGSLWIGQDITERLRAEAEIKAALQEKEILLKEIYHRVKNNLTVVAALLSLQARSIQDPEAKLAFQESEKRVQTMALIHQELYKSSSLAQIDFSDYLYKLISNLYSAYRTRPDVKLIIDVEKINLSVQTAIH